jgi:hypothetical protein
LLLPLALCADAVVMLNRNLEYCSYASTALYGTDDFDELEQQFNKVRRLVSTLLEHQDCACVIVGALWGACTEALEVIALHQVY